MSILFFIILLIAGIPFVALFFRACDSQEKEIGQRGEDIVASHLNSLNPSQYQVIHDLKIKKGPYSSQIDHVVVSPFGIFVIETKNYSGWIFGKEEAPYWVKNIYGQKHQFLNPIKQNESHIYAIKSVLKNYPSIVYHPIVVFIDKDNVELKNTPYRLPVIYHTQLLKYIKTTPFSKNLSDSQVLEITKRLKATDSLTDGQHIQYVRQKIRRQNLDLVSGRCPRCHHKLVLRKSAHGDFYGCQAFPNCRYTIDRQHVG